MKIWKPDNAKVPVKSWGENLEEGAIEQLNNCSKLPFVFHHVASAPDAHLGYGAAIGTIFASKGCVVPNMVGVDAGCGMCAVKTNLTEISTESLKKIMNLIRSKIPVGMNHHKQNTKERLEIVKTLIDQFYEIDDSLKG